MKKSTAILANSLYRSFLCAAIGVVAHRAECKTAAGFAYGVAFVEAADGIRASRNQKKKGITKSNPRL